MIDFLEILTQTEKDKLYNALPLITVLISGADGKIEKKELEWAEKVAHIRSFKMKEPFKSFYQVVDKDFSDKVLQLISDLPSNVSQRNSIIESQLTELNPILSKLDPFYGHKIYKGLITFAHQVAKASGGVLGFMSVSKDEAKWINLPMIDAVHYEGDEEE